MKLKLILICLLFLSGLGVSFAQPANDDCSGALNLCPGITYTATNQGASVEICAGCADGDTTAGNFCFDLNNTVWFSFTTNTSGGNASVVFSNLSCLVGAGNDNEIQAVVIAATNACDASTYTSVSNCEPNSSSGFTLSATGLLPNTTYYVQVDGDLNGAGISNAAQCDFSIGVNGPAVDYDATETVVDQTCGNTDGQITVNAVSGGTPAYQYALNGGTYQSSGVFSNLSAGSYVLSITDGNGCVEYVDTIPVNLLNGPQINSTNATSAHCATNDGTIDVSGVSGGNPAYNYSLNGGASQPGSTFSNLPAGDYLVTVTDQLGCMDTTVVIVTNNSGLTATSGSANADCGATNGTIVVDTSGASGVCTFSLNGGVAQSSAVFTNLAPGSYTIVVTDAAGCTYTLNDVAVSENPPAQVATIEMNSGASIICAGDNASFSAAIVNGGTNPTVNWLVNGSVVQSGSSLTFNSSTLSDGDVVSCQLTSNDPCVAVTNANSSGVTMTVNPVTNPTVSLLSNTTSTCSNEPVTFTATQNGCTGTSTYQWLVNGTPVAADTTGVLSTTLSSNSSVAVNLSCSDPCSNPATSNTINITVTPIQADAGPDQLIGYGQSAQLQGSGGGTYSWNPSSSLSDPASADPIATPGSTTTYYLVVSNNGCSDTAEVTVVVTQPINVPNTFTPNGDGVNDLWEIRNIENYPNCKVTVYDRWGQKVFNTVGYSNTNAWNGTNHGLSIPAAVYYYVIDLNSGASKDGDIFSGSITIVK